MLYWIVIILLLALLVAGATAYYFETQPFEVGHFIDRQVRGFARGQELVHERRQAWPAFANRATEIFNKVVEHAQSEGLFEQLYVSHSPEPRDPNFVTLLWGAHPTGRDWTSSGGRLNIERKCALHFVQGPSGEVACIIYPFSSTLMIPTVKHHVYWLFSSPNAIDQNALHDAVRVMFSVAHQTSFIGSPAWEDRYFYAKLQFFSFLTRLWNLDWTQTAFDILLKLIKKSLEQKEIEEGKQAESPAN